MKKKILIEIDYPDCNTLNVNQADLMTIQNEVLNQLGIVEVVAEGMYEIDAKMIEPIDEYQLDELAREYVENTIWDSATSKDEYEAYKAGYRKAMEE